MKIELAQIFTQIVSFLIVLWVLKKFAWKPFLQILENRETKIRKEFDLIEEGKKENTKMAKLYQEKLENIHEEANELIKTSREKGQKIAKQLEDKAREDAKKIMNASKEDLQKEVYKAKRHLKDELINITLSATKKMVQTSMDKEKQKELVEEFVKEEIH